MVVFETCAAGFAICQSPGNIISTNSVFDELLGLSSSAIPVAIADLIQPQDSRESRRLLSELFQGTRESFQIESPAEGSDTKLRHWTVWAVREENSAPELAVIMLEDRSAAGLGQLRLQQAERMQMIGRLAGGVAHDFNNLLNGVLLYCDLLLSVVGPDDRARTYEKRSAKPDCRHPPWFVNF